MQKIDWKKLRKRWLPEIEVSMGRYILKFSPEKSTLSSMSEYHLSTGGKRLRAILPVAIAEIYGKDPAWILPFASACELLHNATLVHDDLQDGDTTRRGAETVWVKFGVAQSINVGDALLYYAVGALNEMDVPAEKVVALLDLFVRGTIQVIDGQEREFLLIDKEPSMEKYFRMVEGKTSGLFAIPFCGSLLLCDVEPDVISKVNEASQHLGVIFQIQDDVLDIFAEKGRERKGSDIAEGKRSVLATFTLLNAEEENRAFVEEVLNRKREDVSDGDIEKVSNIFRTCGALDFSLKEIYERVDKIRALLGDEPELLDVANALIETFLEPIKKVSEFTKVNSK